MATRMTSHHVKILIGARLVVRDGEGYLHVCLDALTALSDGIEALP